jgi:hypothetical protein
VIATLVVGGLDAIFAAAAAAARAPAVGEAAAHYSQWIAWAHEREHTAAELLPNLSALRAYEEGATLADEAGAGAAAGAGAGGGNDDAVGFSIGGDGGGFSIGGDSGGGFSIGGDSGPPGIVAAPSRGIDWGIEDVASPGIVEPPAGGIDWDLGALSMDDVDASAGAGVVEVPVGGIDWDLGAAVVEEAGGGAVHVPFLTFFLTFS